MPGRGVGIVQTGTANLASVVAAFSRMSVTARLVWSPDDYDDTTPLVLPGVGAFQAAMSRLDQSGLSRIIRDHVTGGKPFLAVCLGLQLMAEESEESPGVKGLGVFTGKAVQLPSSVKLPQMGWNRVNWRDGSWNWGWYANSYCLESAESSWQVATSIYGKQFIAAIKRPRQLACQFHPELSGVEGMKLLSEWWRTC